ncbi:hypothetical protein HK105_200925 [Polyrhizophydium stewartii]|uniref:Cyclic nucleotide-binding domain-containing protein n=1 Tax=Polyrhizophydium stewartii TaxID=2732419 RepID=A0ABR4NIC2_9FUNG
MQDTPAKPAKSLLARGKLSFLNKPGMRLNMSAIKGSDGPQSAPVNLDPKLAAISNVPQGVRQAHEPGEATEAAVAHGPGTPPPSQSSGVPMSPRQSGQRIISRFATSTAQFDTFERGKARASPVPRRRVDGEALHAPDADRHHGAGGQSSRTTTISGSSATLKTHRPDGESEKSQSPTAHGKLQRYIMGLQQQNRARSMASLDDKAQLPSASRNLRDTTASRSEAHIGTEASPRGSPRGSPKSSRQLGVSSTPSSPKSPQSPTSNLFKTGRSLTRLNRADSRAGPRSRERAYSNREKVSKSRDEILRSHNALIRGLNSRGESVSTLEHKEAKTASQLSIRSRARMLWSFALTQVADQVHKSAVVRGVFEPTHVDTLTMLAQLNKEATEALNQLRGMGPTQSGLSAIERMKNIESIIMTPWEARSDAQTRSLFNMLGQLSSFSRFSAATRQELLKYVKFDKFGPGRVVIKSGQLCLSCYILLEGTCLAKPDFRVDISGAAVVTPPYEITSGQFFGEFSLTSRSERRTVTVTTLTKCHVLRIEREDFKRVMQTTSGSEHNERLSFLREVAAFERTSDEVMRELVLVMQLITVAPDAVVLKPGETEFVYFLKHGLLRATREVRFLKDIGKGGAASGATCGASVPQGAPSGSAAATSPPAQRKEAADPMSGIIPFQYGQRYDAQVQQVVKFDLRIGDITPGQFFPRIFMLPEEIIDFRVQDVPASKIAILAAAQEARGCTAELRQQAERGDDPIMQQEYVAIERFAASLDLQVTAPQRCECYRIARFDLISAVDDDTLARLCNPFYEGLLGVSMDEIQRSFISQRVWDGFKKKK